MSRPHATSLPTRITAPRNDGALRLHGRKTTHYSPALSRVWTPWAQCLDAHVPRTAQHQHDIDTHPRQLPRTNRAASEAASRIRRRPDGRASASMAWTAVLVVPTRCTHRCTAAPLRPTHPSKWSRTPRGARALSPASPSSPAQSRPVPSSPVPCLYVDSPSYLQPTQPQSQPSTEPSQSTRTTHTLSYVAVRAASGALPTVACRGSAVTKPHTEPQCPNRRSLDHPCAWSRG
jgi:hypothetical protein